MKILAIRGKNLASLRGEFEVNFRTEPLRSAGLFAITGNTGSGKTTILDAMCIALYEKTPRLEGIQNREVIETHGKTKIFENNAKTILSKGCHHGYAEVEFLAVDGKEYRVRTTISRAGKQANGNFRDTEYDVSDMTDGTHISCSATEYRNMVPSLVGLTYEEFTRAVLLSQGNFAAFLKAPENEKASILQKLTGTGIYRRISQMIHRHYSTAIQDLNLVKKQMNDIKPLPEEKLEELQNNLKVLEEQNVRNEATISRLVAEKQWFERLFVLERELSDAQNNHEKAIALKEENRPIAEKLERIDSVQDIRDTYMQRVSVAELCKTECEALDALKGDMVLAVETLANAERQTKEAEDIVAKVQNEYDVFRPKIKEAIKIEEQIKGLEKSLAESTEAQKRCCKEKKVLLSAIDAAQESLRLIAEESRNIETWFKEHESYRAIIPEIPVLISDMRTIAERRTQVLEQRKLLAGTIAALADFENRLSEAKTKDEELAGTLTKEIAELRNRLVDGEPCPVCGSRHHEFVPGTQKTLAETELEKARECVKKYIEHLTQSIDTYKRDITREQSNIEFYENSITTLTGKCMGLLNGIMDDKEKLHDAGTINRLADVAKTWEKNTSRIAAINENVSVKTNTLQFSGKRVEELDKALEEHATVILAKNGKIKENKGLLTALLGKWESGEETERYFERSVSETNKAFSLASEKKIAATSRYNQLKGGIDEKEKLVASQKKNIKELDARIDLYLQQRTDGMNRAELESLLAPVSKINEMRAKVEEVKKELLKSSITLGDRKRDIEEHNKAATRPEENRSINEIKAESEKAIGLRASIVEERSSINAVLLKDKEDNEKISKFWEDHEKKRKIAEDWGELDSRFGSADGSVLTRLTQGYTLDILLDVANMHLKEFSGRYILSRISQNSLAIKVIDLEMMSDSRSVHTLSGGETFLASLALSLALSSVSSNKMNIESLFIDEGFGALDGETLKEAIDVLEKLQSTGRKVGVISHLGEMLQRIPTRIRVLKTGNGKSRIVTE